MNGDLLKLLDLGVTGVIALLLLKYLFNEARHNSQKLDEIIRLLRRGFNIED